MSVPAVLELRDCGRILRIGRGSTGSFFVFLYDKPAKRTAPPKQLAYAIGNRLRLTQSNGAHVVWIDSSGSSAAAAFELNCREAERLSDWAGIPMPEGSDEA